MLLVVVEKEMVDPTDAAVTIDKRRSVVRRVVAR
jgi:hypothetical protein